MADTDKESIPIANVGAGKCLSRLTSAVPTFCLLSILFGPRGGGGAANKMQGKQVRLPLFLGVSRRRRHSGLQYKLFFVGEERF